MAEKIAARAAGEIKNSLNLKILIIGMLALLLLIPAGMVKGLIREREHRKADVIGEISSKWGNAQTVSGPVLTLPYKRYYKNDKGEDRYNIRFMHFLPDELKIAGELHPEVRYRGIYEAVLYNTGLTLSGRFSVPAVSKLNIPSENVMWSRAFLSVGISDMRGIKERIAAELNGKAVEFEPGIKTSDVLTSGVSLLWPMPPGGKELAFRIPLNLNGSENLSFVPVGEETRVEMASEWPSPSFTGAFLPEERQVGDTGFSAQWRVLHLNRNFPQQWIGEKQDIDDYAFGVKLFIAADVYQKSTRTAKYAVMFIAFTFLAFFFSEVMNRLRVHPIQYLLVGFAVLVFYTLLISLSEHVGFDAAYLISAGGVIALVTGYARGVFGNRYLTLTIGGVLFILYLYLCIVLQLEDYALLMGSVGLFTVLAVVMYATRKVDWYAIQMESAGAAQAPPEPAPEPPAPPA